MNANTKTDGVFVDFEPTTKEFVVRGLFVESKLSPREQLEIWKKRRKDFITNGKRQHFIFFIETGIDEQSNPYMKITDFFKAVLLDPSYYVKNLWKGKQLAFVIDEFAMKEKLKSKETKNKKFSNWELYVMGTFLIENIYRGAFNFDRQRTKEYFNSISNESEL